MNADCQSDTKLLLVLGNLNITKLTQGKLS